MAAICDMALGRLADRRYFLGIVQFLNKNRFHEKEGGQFFHTNGICCVLLAVVVCCLLLTAPNKGKIISVSHVTDGVF